ncbi:uncharacterized protein LOC100833139 [Brachypodium distachyon]|uniref:Uncharacterized protein n=1 Tax=Brachypodium distachyon TaxID=15368 RepID=I1GZY7_BRADI|nr:uncharacterized protein LOC100833139 [Brachypodium distachyon]KQK19092.1 hypothetical protein BRADI_1g46320v3 [Brachypodium distachyon]|eukprot:XP_003560949.1 uncharacterized protein LOC100833139 [Brachypodium distachyon]
MASGGYGSPYSYYQPPPAATPYYYSYVHQPARRGFPGGGPRPSSVPLFLLLATLLLLAAGTLYAWFEAAVESLLGQLRPLLVLSPLLLIVAVQLWVASAGGDRRGGFAYLLWQMAAGDDQQPCYDGRWDGGASSSPWGVAVALALVLLLVSCQSSFPDWRSPLLRRR